MPDPSFASPSPSLLPAAAPPRGPGPGRLRAVLALSVAWCAWWFWQALGYWEDDAYIHLEFARSLARGRGFNFNGQVVYGDTSPLWVWLLEAMHAVIPRWMAAGKTLTALAAVFALSGAYALAHSLYAGEASTGSRRGGDPPLGASIFAAGMLLVVVTAPYFGYWAFSGMEALAAAGLACWAAWALAAAPLPAGRFFAAAAAAGVAPLLRPEMIFFTALTGVWLLVDLVRVPRPGGRRVARGLGGLALLATPTAAWAVYAERTFGSVLPNTDAAKRAAPGDSIVTRLVHLYAFGYPVTLLALLLLAAAAAWLLLRGQRARLAAMAATLHPGGWLFLVWTALVSVFYVENHTYVQTRYIFITAPGLTLTAFALAARCWPALYRALLPAALLFGVAVSLISTRPLVHNKVVIDRTYAELAGELRRLPPGAPVAHYSIGEAAFLSEHPLVDTGGITRPGILPLLWDSGDERRIAWIYAQGAQYDVIDHAPVPGAELLWSRELPATGWYFDPRLYRATERLQLWKLPPRHP